MNLFLLGWNVPPALSSELLTHLGQMVAIYPQLDPHSLWHHADNRGLVFAASMHPRPEVCAPRRYVARSGSDVLLFSGTVLDKSGRYKANDASILLSHWDDLADSLEGQFAVARITGASPRLDLLIDPLGIEQVYFWRDRDAWLISNSVALLERITRATSLDPLGVSLMLTLGWAGGDRTLRDGVRVLPGGQLLSWRDGDPEPQRRVYFSSAELSRLPQGGVTPRGLSELADQLIRLCKACAGTYRDLRCPLTGGRDSRVLACLLVAAGAQATYYTSGDPSCTDVRIGTQLARMLDLPHELHTRTSKDILDAGWAPVHRLIRQNDGLVTLWQVADFIDDVDRMVPLHMSLWGLGGEIARAYFSSPLMLMGRSDAGAVTRLLCEKLLTSHAGLVADGAVELARQYLESFVAQALEQGFRAIDIPDVLYAYERVRRWGGSNARKSKPSGDRFTPFCTRPFVEAAFGLPARSRYVEPLHYGLVRLLAPEVHAVAFDSGRWRVQSPLLGIALSTAERALRKLHAGARSAADREVPAFDRAAWMEANRLELRERCLDQSDPTVWSFICRDAFDRLTSDATNAADRRRTLAGLYDAATVLLYAAGDA